jgi:hypothetical protein
LTALLRARPDVLVQPVPRGFSQLAQRLGGAESLDAALRMAKRDMVIVGQAIAALGASATVSGLGQLLGASEQAVRDAVAELCERGLAWESSGSLCLPERLEAHWLAEIGGGRPVAKIAGSIFTENLRAALGAFVAATDGLRKPELAARLSGFMADLPLLTKIITELPKPAQDRLGEYRRGYHEYYAGFGRWRSPVGWPNASSRSPAVRSFPQPAPTRRRCAGPPRMRSGGDDLGSAAGLLRRALLSAARSGASVHAAGKEIDWFLPLHGYDAEQRADKVAAAVREAELLGVIATDAVSELGAHLLAVTGSTPEEKVVEELARRCAALLPETPCSVILQSDLTAVVSGQPSAAVSRLLNDSAIAETHGATRTWRFTSASVRGALDTGWTAQELLTELAAISARPVPQPLEYLITDASRRYGQVRVRGRRSCVIADETLITEILHTRSLTKLHLSRLAPTVLSSPSSLDDVLAACVKSACPRWQKTP